MLTNKFEDAFSGLVKNIIWSDIVGIWEEFKKIKQEQGALIIFDKDTSVYKTLTELEYDDSTNYPEFTEINKLIREQVKASLDANFCVVVFFRSNIAAIKRVPLDPEERRVLLGS